MMFTVYVAPHERADALEAYEDRLTAEAKEQIRDAEDDAVIRILWDASGLRVEVLPAPGRLP